MFANRLNIRKLFFGIHLATRKKTILMDSPGIDKIFLVDDDLFSLNMHEQLLCNLGYKNLSVFSTGSACLAALTQPPEIIMLDQTMEAMAGLEIIKKVKRDTPEVYVICLCPAEHIDSAETSMQYGAFDYVVKGRQAQQQIKQVLSRIISIKDQLKIFRQQEKG
jgi:DNA-binding NtrC family response regulator